MGGDDYLAIAESAGGNIDSRGNRGFESRLHLDPLLDFVSLPPSTKRSLYCPLSGLGLARRGRWPHEAKAEVLEGKLP